MRSQTRNGTTLGWVRLLTVFLAVIWGCTSDGDGSGVTGTSGQGSSASIIQPSAVAIASGDGQSATVGTAVGQPLVVKVSNAAGSGVKGLTVTWSVTQGGGTLSATSTTTVDGGIATQPTWTLGTTAGKQQVSATVTGLKAVTFNAEGNPASPASISITPPQLTLQVGESQTLTAAAKDNYGNDITKGITWSSSNPTVAVVEGAGVVRALYPGAVTITASVSGAQATSALTVTAPPAASVARVSGQSQQGIAGQPLANPLVVVARDAAGSSVPGVEVTWTVTQGGGTVSPGSDSASPAPSGPSASSEGGLTTATDINGQARARWTLGPNAGTQSVSATVGGSASTVFVASASAGDPTTVVVTPTEATLGVGQTLTLTATPRDAGGNAVFTSVAWTSSDPTVASVDSNTGLVTGIGVGTATITGTAGSAQGTAQVTVTSQTPSLVVAIAGDGQAGTVGTALGNPLVAEVRDSGGNPVSGVSVQWRVTQGNGSVSATSNVTDGSGRTQATFTLGTIAGTNEVAVEVHGLTPLFFTATGLAGTATSIEVLPAFLTVGIGQSANLTSVPRDTYGNTVTVPVTWTSQSPSVVSVDGAGQVTGVSSGLAVIEASLGEVVGSAEVTVPSTAPGSISAISGGSQTATVGATLPQPLGVRVLSTGGDPMEGIAVQWAVTRGGGNVSATSTRTNASGEAQVSWTMGTTAGAGEVTASVSGLSPQVFNATATAGPVASVVVSPDPATVVAGKTLSFSASATDAFGNALSPSVSWSSSDESVAMINASSGIATGMVAGSAIITALAGGVSGSASLTVNPVPAPTAVSDLTVESTTESSAGLAFHEVNDGKDQPASYEIRYYTGSGTWDTATPVILGSCSGVIQGTGIGNLVNCTVDGLTAGTSYRFLARSRRVESGNDIVYGGVSNAAFTTIPSTDPTIPASLVIVDGSGQTGPVGAPLPQSLVVEARNAEGDVLSGIQVDWTVPEGAGSVDLLGSSTTDSNGQVEAQWTLGTVPGTYRVSVSYSGSLTNEFSATATAGPVAAITISPSSKAVDVGASTAFSALARDAFGNLVYPTYNWSSQATSIATPVSPPGTFFGVSAGNTLVMASAEGVTAQASLTVSAVSTPTIQAVSGNGQTGEVGTVLPDPLVVELRDAQGNPSAGFSVSWTVTAGGGTVSSTSTITNSQGQAQVSWTLGPAGGGNSVKASVTGVGSVTFSATATGGGAGIPVTVQDGFESGDLSYTNAAGFIWGLQNAPGRLGVNVSVSSDHAYSGSYSLAFRYPAKPLDKDATAEQHFILAANASDAPNEVWIEYMVRVPENYKHRDATGGDNNKLLAIWAENYGGSATEAMFVAEFERTNDDTSYIRYSVGAGEGETVAVTQNMDVRETLFSAGDRGKWVQLRFHLKIGDLAGTPGVLDTYKDGLLIGSMPADWIVAEGESFDYFRKGYLFGWSNSAYNEDTIFYIDDFQVYSSSPGW